MSSINKLLGKIIVNLRKIVFITLQLFFISYRFKDRFINLINVIPKRLIYTSDIKNTKKFKIKKFFLPLKLTRVKNNWRNELNE